jgi:hypothetical protein
MLDLWLKEVCYNFRDMPPPARTEIRSFLSFNLMATKDTFMHDQLLWGMIEPPKNDASVLIIRKETIVALHDGLLDEPGRAVSTRMPSKMVSVNYTAKNRKANSVA